MNLAERSTDGRYEEPEICKEACLLYCLGVRSAGFRPKPIEQIYKQPDQLTHTHTRTLNLERSSPRTSYQNTHKLSVTTNEACT